MTRVLVIDDDPAIGRSLQLQLQGEGYVVDTRTDATKGVSAAREFMPDVVLLDVQLPDRDGLDVLPELLGLDPAPQVIVITGRQDMSATIHAIQQGAADFIRKPLDILLVKDALQKATAQRASAQRSSRTGDPGEIEAALASPREIVGKSRAIIDVLTKVAQYAAVKVHVLIEGESGTGKELVARAIHDTSSPGKPFVAVNCVALAAGVWESEIFGHEKGAFTGADRRHRGRLELAGDGTVFLDEIGDLPPEMQGKLLRVIQERVFERVGGTEAVPFAARIIAATHCDTQTMVSEGAFREDLMHRLAVARIDVPPLRDRREDIPLLVMALLARISSAFGRAVNAVADEAMTKLVKYDWPGNVRELENVLMRSVASCRGETLTEVELSRSARAPITNGGSAVAGSSAEPATVSEDWSLQQMERRHVRAALDHFEWNITQTARALDISPTTLRKKIRDYEIREGKP